MLDVMDSISHLSEECQKVGLYESIESAFEELSDMCASFKTETVHSKFSKLNEAIASLSMVTPIFQGSNH